MSDSAVVSMLNRRLAKFGEQVKTCRYDSRDFNDLGRFYVLNIEQNCIAHHDVDPREMLEKLVAE